MADVGFITTDNVAAIDAAHVPPYYAANSLSCDCWFMLHDIRVTARDDLEGVTAELKRLRNTRYHDRPVPIYGGMVDPPLLVVRDDDRRLFDERERELLTDGERWARFDAEQGGWAHSKPRCAMSISGSARGRRLIGPRDAWSRGRRVDCGNCG